MMFVKSSALLPAFFAATTLFSGAFAAPGRSGLTRRQYDPAACNNHPSLCNKKYDDIYWLGAHDSPFIRHPENGYSVAGNQYFNVHTQLEAGVRLLQGQIHNEGGKPRLCHSECKMMDGGKLEDYLVEVKDWLDKHPSDVVTMLWVNADNMPAKDLQKYFVDTGLKDLAYIPPNRPLRPGQWPTLKQMIDSGKRLVLFLSGGTDEAAVPWILDQFSYMFETPFENFDPAKFTCAGDRPGAIRGPEKMKEAVDTRIGFQNRFLYDKKLEELGLEIYTPDPKRAPRVNSGDQSVTGNLKDGIEKCAAEWGRRGGFLLVDFFNEGNPMAVVDSANGFNDPRNRVNAPLSYKNAPKELWKPTKSAGEMSLLFDKGSDAIDEVVTPVKDTVEDVKDKVEDVKDKVEEVKDKVDDVKDKIDVIKKPIENIGDKVKDGWKDFLGFFGR